MSLATSPSRPSQTPSRRASGSGRAAQRRQRERQARIDLICDAATRVFARQGYGAASMEQVAEAAGLGKATLYYYFKTKHELLGAILDREHQALATLSRQHLEQGASAIQTARAICHHWSAHFARQPELAALLLPVMAGGQQGLPAELAAVVAAQSRAAHAPLLEALAALARTHRRGRALPPLISTFLLGLVARCAGGSAQDLGDEIDLFFDVVEHKLGRARK